MDIIVGMIVEIICSYLYYVMGHIDIIIHLNQTQIVQL